MVMNCYSDPDVRARMLEFAGGDAPENVTCRFLAAFESGPADRTAPLDPEHLSRLWEEGHGVRRSLWDRKALVASLSVGYVNFGSPAEADLEPDRAFHLMRPVEWAIEAVLLDYGLRPLHLLAGTRHLFVWRVRRSSAGFRALAKLGHLPPTLRQFYAQPQRPRGEIVAPEWALAFAGLGLVMEFVAHRVRELAGLVGDLPAELAVVESGPAQRGSEAVAVDLSAYGDPLTAGTICMPFSLCSPHGEASNRSGDPAAPTVHPIFAVPLPQAYRREDLRVWRDPGKVMDLARRVSTRIPDQSRSTELLVAAYRKSEWAAYHDWFHAEEQDPRETWPATYDATPLQTLPACVRYMLEHPNDLLLQPTVLERVVRVMLALGWHPRHIAGLLRSKYERDFGWRDRWQGRDPALRADFCARVLSAQAIVGGDNLLDLDCLTAKGQQLCFRNDCPADLAQFRRSLLDRRAFERLAARPFNRLFVPGQATVIEGSR